MEADEKICPRCAETVKAAALVCKHCGHEFASAQTNIVPPPPAAPQPAAPQVSSSPLGVTLPPPPMANPAPKGRTVLIVAAVIVGVIVLLGVLGAIVGSGPNGSASQQTAGNDAAPSSDNGAGTGDSSAPAAEDNSGDNHEASDATAVTSVELARAYGANEVAAQKTYGDKTLDVSGTITGVTLDIFNNPVVQLEGVNEFLPVQAAFDKSYSDKIGALTKGDQITVRCTSITEVISAPQLSDCTIPE